MTNSDNSLRRVPLTAIKPNDVALRGPQTDDKTFADLLASVKAKGVLEPILVNDNKDGTFTLINGLQRYTAATMARAEDNTQPDTIPAHVIQVDNEEQLVFQIITNNNTIKTRPSEYAEGLARILAHDPNMSQAQLAEKLNMSGPTISNLLKLAKLDPAIKALVDDGSIKVTNAYILSRIPTADQSQFLEAAQTDSPDVFTTKIAEFQKAEKARKAGLPEPTAPSVKLRKRNEIEDRYNQLATQMGQTNNPDPVLVAQVNILAWALHQDEESVSEWKNKREQANIDKAKKEAEATKKKADEAAAKAEEARKKMAAVTAHA